MLLKIAAVAGCACALAQAALKPGWNEVPIRDVPQDVLRIATRSPDKDTTVLFLPGDGGWRGAAKDIAEAIAGSGYEVYVWDTKRYLTSFTRGRSTLREEQIGSDFAAMRIVIARIPEERVVLVGWSQGAALSVVATAMSLRFMPVLKMRNMRSLVPLTATGEQFRPISSSTNPRRRRSAPNHSDHSGSAGRPNLTAKRRRTNSEEPS